MCSSDLNRGMTQLAVANAITHSDERLAILVGLDYLSFLNRTPDTRESGGWTAQLKAGASEQDVAAGFAASTEFIKGRSPGNLHQWVADAYTSILGRSAAESEIQGWLAALGGEGIWSTLTPMPSKRQELATAVLNGEIYVIGGYDTNGNSADTVEVYHPQTDTWRSAASLPIATNHNAAAVAAGTLYAFGGTSNRVFAYDPQRNAWNEVAPMHYQHGNSAAIGVIGDKIYVAGGTGAGMQQNEVEVYDPVSNTWTVLPSMHVPRNHTAGGVIDGKFYVVGGRDNPGAPSALERYDPNTSTWTQLAPMPTGRSGLAAAGFGGRLYAFGGEVPQLHSEVEVYTPQEDIWEKLEPMPNPRHGIFAAVIDNAIYIIGGGTQQGFGASNVNQVFVVG